LGIESDYIENMDETYAKVFQKYPFDYVIGSVHHVSKVHVFERNRWTGGGVTALDVFREYYRLVAKSAQTGLFDILAHTSAILAYAPQPFQAELADIQDEALTAVAATNSVIEVNTSGYRKMNTDPYPTMRMVEKAAELGIPLTFSSDCHRADEVGVARDKVEALLVRAGVTQLATFENRQRIMIPFAATTVVC
jgi:histidinol-phosphatase (PHP family)